MKVATMLCAGCDKLIETGEPRWAGREPDAYWHYACAQLAGWARSIQSEHVGKEENTPDGGGQAGPSPGNARTAPALRQEAGQRDRPLKMALAMRDIAATFRNRGGIQG